MAGARCPPPERPLSVVVVDDEPDVATYLAAVLERNGHVVYTAQTAADGFAIVKKLRPDVACIDIVMPEETGVALFQRIRADKEVGGTPVVFITALKPEMTAPQDGLTGEPIPEAEEYVEKPPNAESFVAAVERAARSRRRET
jgi:two-component system alkaline phosphatase synthesis response regulator PhoP